MKPVRVLQVVSRMHRGGVETWLMHVLRHTDRAKVQMDFLVNSAEPADYDAEIRALGSRVLPCPSRSRPHAFAKNFAALLRKHGPYDVVHSHVQQYAGYVLALAKAAGIRTRIAHSHTAPPKDLRRPWSRRVYEAGLRFGIRQFATRGLAASELAAASLFGDDWKNDPRWSVLHCGLDFSAFWETRKDHAIRNELSIPTDAAVVGHVGRFDPAKNHAFLLQIAYEVCRLEPRAHFILVGDGPLRPSIEAEAVRLGIHERVHFTGVRRDVPAILQELDAFVLPSVREGLPLVGLEAQAAGLPIVISDAVTSELAVVRELFHWMSISEPADRWAATLVRCLRSPRCRADACLALMEASDFGLAQSLAKLEAAYAA